MLVQRVTTATGSRIDPPLNDSWSDLKKLEWKAAVIEADTGLKIEIYDPRSATKFFGGWVRDRPRRYGFLVGCSSAASFSFGQAWTFMNGIELGYKTAGAVA